MRHRGILDLAFITFAAWTFPGQPSAAQTTDALKSLARQSLVKIDGNLSVPGVHEPVEIIRDKWGVTHIYARNEDDLFFAQGQRVCFARLQSTSILNALSNCRASKLLLGVLTTSSFASIT